MPAGFGPARWPRPHGVYVTAPIRRLVARDPAAEHPPLRLDGRRAYNQLSLDE